MNASTTTLIPPNVNCQKQQGPNKNNAFISDISDATDSEDYIDEQLTRYQKLSKIGEGSYGQVFKARQRLSNRYVAIKKMNLHRYQEGVPVTVLRELAILKELNHRNVLRLQDLIYHGAYVYAVTDLLDMDLRTYMEKYGREGVTSAHIKSFLHQALSGLLYCHKMRIIHRDLKPENLLLEEPTGRLIIADFGLSRQFDIPMRAYTHNVVTRWYRAPEILLGTAFYSTAVDIWSMGCIFAEMMTMNPIFPGDSEIDQLFHIFQLLGTPNNDLWLGVGHLPDYNPCFPAWKSRDLNLSFKSKYKRSYLELDQDALTLLKGMLTYDPYLRLSAKKALESPYFYCDMSKLLFE
ncbi:cell division control protein 2 homolog [Lichtheimia corymbifera JMRC:FSU:9682]|uniref:Cyclin-dependent kinase 1 n=1 Tax=Lichtheimia corymbifera JMRC:FSU:9682 TaxID=1263082 RepID=A0A068RFP6_9FUNG|nr:cell division control protein 2 homolog [Lichtheimia corymbifera JMRC:FSU:9682]